MLVDLHIHSCLSPCAEEDMTPANICGMAHIKGLDAIAVTDHSSARSLPYVKEAADYYGLILLPGIEVTTREEVHLLGYFPTVEAAVEAGGRGLNSRERDALQAALTLIAANLEHIIREGIPEKAAAGRCVK